jgi:hypothetical protein
MIPTAQGLRPQKKATTRKNGKDPNRMQVVSCCNMNAKKK